MGLFHHHKDDHDVVTSPDFDPRKHEAKKSHEIIAAAAAYEAAKAWEEHKKKQGVDTSHSKMKEFLAAAAGAFAVKIAETKGADYLDKRQLEKQAQERATAFDQ